jgi:hypothetical protein
MHAAVAIVIIVILGAIVFMLINMNRIMNFMTAFLVPWHAYATTISRALKNGQGHAD